jgi:hypothetical protein
MSWLVLSDVNIDARKSTELRSDKSFGVPNSKRHQWQGREEASAVSPGDLGT